MTRVNISNLQRYFVAISLKQKIAIGLLGTLLFSGMFIQLFHSLSFYRAEQAYKSADCKTAISRFKAILTSGFGGFGDTAAKAAAYKAECEYYLTLPASETGPQDTTHAVINAHDVTQKFSNSPLAVSLQTQAIEAFSIGNLAEVPTVPVCDRLLTLFSQNWLFSKGATAPPQFTYQCGQVFLTEQNFQAAAVPLQFFLENYPDHSLISTVEPLYAQAMIGAAKASGAGTLPPPSAVGYTNNGSTVVQIANASPEKMRIIFSGPEPRFEELPPCETCKVQSTTEPSEDICAGDLPDGIYPITPGDYQVLVRAISDRGVTPFTGEWTLAADMGYSQCFFISQSLDPTVPDQQGTPTPIPLP